MKLSDTIQTKKAILFDLFHTLTSIETTHDIRPMETHEILNIDYDAWIQKFRAFTDRRSRGDHENIDDELMRIIQSIDTTIPPELMKRAMQTRRDKFKRSLTHCGSDTIAALDTIKKTKRIGLVSNADKMEIEAWDTTELAKRFEAAVFSCHCGYVKPEPEIYLTACRALGVSPEDCVFVGDGGSDELTGAKNVGMIPVQMKGIVEKLSPEIAERQKAGSMFRINSIAELAEAI